MLGCRSPLCFRDKYVMVLHLKNLCKSIFHHYDKFQIWMTIYKQPLKFAYSSLAKLAIVKLGRVCVEAQPYMVLDFLSGW